jgi:opacity protein-like surface antigen
MQDEFIPYLTAGIGLNRVNADINIELSEGSYSAKFDDINDTVFMGQVGAGICFKTSDMSCWDLRYKYLFAEDVELPFSATIESQVVSADLDFEIKGHQLLLGYIQLF